MLLSKDAIGDVADILRGQDFYKPAHWTVHRAILDIHHKGEPDSITVAAHLTRTGELKKIGGAAYLHSLLQQVPTAAAAEHCAEIVYAAVARNRVAAGTAIAASGYARDATPTNWSSVPRSACTAWSATAATALSMTSTPPASARRAS